MSSGAQNNQENLASKDLTNTDKIFEIVTGQVRYFLAIIVHMNIQPEMFLVYFFLPLSFAIMRLQSTIKAI